MAAGPSDPSFPVLCPIPLDVNFGAVRKTAGKTFGFAIPTDLLRKLEQEFAGCTSPKERLGLYMRCFPWRKPCAKDNDSMKEAKTSYEHLAAAHENYIKKEYLSASQHCNRAITCAPLDDEVLGRAYADRSEALMALNEPEEALLDIERALTSRCPPVMHPGLLRRKARCEIMKKEKEISELPKTSKHSCEVNFEKLRNTDRFAARKYYKKVLFPYKSSKSEELRTFVSNVVELRELDGQTCLVMKDEALAGTVLLIDKPYTAVSTDYLDGNCDYCLKILLGGIPCNKCVNVLYCNEICRDKAKEEFHGRFECFFMNYFARVKATAEVKPIVLVVLRIISKLGPDCLYKLFQDGPEASSNPSASRPKALSDYMKIYNILKPAESIRPSTQLGHWIQARILASILDRKTSFFESVNPEKKNDFKEFLTTFIIRHLESPKVALPLQVVSKENTMKGTRQRGQYLEGEMDEAMRKLLFCSDYAMGVYPVASNLCQSCEPNVIVQCAVKGAGVAVLASRLLKKGEVLRIHFAWHFMYASREERQKILRETLFIECHCLACREEWPEYNVLKNELPKFCCPHCTSQFSFIQKGRRSFDECVVSEPHFRCPKCRKSFGGQKFAKQMDMINKKTALCKSRIAEERPFAVMTEALEAMKLHHQNQICPPFFEALWHQEILRGALAHMISSYVEPEPIPPGCKGKN